ncbi:glycosyltransferase [Actinomadura sp. 6N118]|uniref:glycosyltransferase n=1 Tax=Actinomadura sp. 6N118 TaxID=3375151 RepID=UPI0037AC1F1E
MSEANNMKRWLYVDTYTSPADVAAGDVAAGPSSDSIGYGITASAAIVAELEARGFDVIRVNPHTPAGQGSRSDSRARWTANVYRRIVDAIDREHPDLIFIFHIFSVFPSVIRKALQDMGTDIPVIGYTHGSHWDPTDTYRADRHPRLRLLDLANIDSLDRLLVVSEYMCRTLEENIGALSPALANDVTNKTSIVGLPLDTTQIQRQWTGEQFDRTTIVFNHAPIESKRPKVFTQAANEILDRHDAVIVFTRRFAEEDPGGKEVSELADRHPGQVVLGNDMSIADYYRTLWRSHIQVSTASHESFGVATLEAMYTHNCCLLPTKGAYPEICHNNPDVLYDGTVSTLVKRLTHLIKSPYERRRMSVELSKIAMLHDAPAVVDRILESISDIASSHRVKGSND